MERINIRLKYYDQIMAFFVVVLIVSNMASSAKIVDMRFSLFNIPMIFDGGTLLFPFSYILGDILTEVYGFKASRRVIWTGFIALIMTSLVFFVLRLLPGEAMWEDYAGSAAYDAILGGISSGGITLACILAYWVGAFSNSFILSKMKVLMKGRLFWARAIGSTLVGEFLDSFIFIFIATVTGVFFWEQFWPLILTNFFLKCFIEVLVLPLTYLITGALKKAEGIDTYDHGIKYNPFTGR